MKILSNTEQGGRVVELSRDEMVELYLLMKTCDDSVLDEKEARWDLGALPDPRFSGYLPDSGFDFSKLFSIIRAWRIAKFSVNNLRHLTDAIEKAISS